MGRWSVKPKPHALAFVAAALTVSASGQVQQDWRATQWRPWVPPITWSPTIGPSWQAGSPLDQGFADVGPASTSLRQVQIDPRSPVGFEQVFRTRDGNLMRQDGGIRAIFPRSAYVVDANGPRPEVPAGTVFHIGSEDPGLVTPRQDPTVQTHGVDRRVQTRIDATPSWGRRYEPQRAGSRASSLATNEASIPDGAQAVVTLFSSESYRRARVASLLHRTIEAGP